MFTINKRTVKFKAELVQGLVFGAIRERSGNNIHKRTKWIIALGFFYVEVATTVYLPQVIEERV